MVGFPCKNMADDGRDGNIEMMDDEAPILESSLVRAVI